ncbi:MAG: hypothetical protein KF897_10160 [Opitutaceae bacterium]|nr:hypothetical protein [Opitutaceae bacterium]
MKGWLGDLGRTIWALFYWNLRKSVYRLRGRLGQCPCHNPSDTGAPLETGCEAVLGWRQPRRFRRVCPLLRQNARGQWVCSVRPEEVRPYWGRAAALVAGLGGALALGVLLSAFGLMRGIGYDVSLRQLAWPPAWHELHEVRARLFIEQARQAYAAGRVREALGALVVAYEMDPSNYSVAMMLAQFYQAGNPALADTLYGNLLREHPAHRVETARVWFRSLLARGQLRGIAELARRQLALEPQQAAAWVHALNFAARHRDEPAILDAAVAIPDLPAAVQDTLRLASRVLRLPRAEARAALLSLPAKPEFVYDRVYRIETLTRLGFAEEAYDLLLNSRPLLAGRDVARLAFAIYAQRGDHARLEREYDALLASGRPLRGHELSLLAIHLVEWPDARLLDKVCAAFPRLAAEPIEGQLEAGLAVFCAAGTARDGSRMADIQQQLAKTTKIPLSGMNRLGSFFLAESGKIRIENILPQQNSMSLELNYALLERYLSK